MVFTPGNLRTGGALTVIGVPAAALRVELPEAVHVPSLDWTVQVAWTTNEPARGAVKRRTTAWLPAICWAL
jgi:hypothetical protein